MIFEHKQTRRGRQFRTGFDIGVTQAHRACGMRAQHRISGKGQPLGQLGADSLLIFADDGQLLLDQATKKTNPPVDAAGIVQLATCACPGQLKTLTGNRLSTNIPFPTRALCSSGLESRLLTNRVCTHHIQRGDAATLCELLDRDQILFGTRQNCGCFMRLQACQTTTAFLVQFLGFALGRMDDIIGPHIDRLHQQLIELPLAIESLTDGVGFELGQLRLLLGDPLEQHGGVVMHQDLTSGDAGAVADYFREGHPIERRGIRHRSAIIDPAGNSQSQLAIDGLGGNYALRIDGFFNLIAASGHEYCEQGQQG